MRKLALSVSAALLAAAMLAAPELFSQEKTEPAKTEVKREFKGRLPVYYGRLGLSEEQVSRIYSVQIKHNDELQNLVKQLTDLRAKIKSEVESVLTAEQKMKLDMLIAEAKKKAEEARKASAKPADPKADVKPAADSK